MERPLAGWYPDPVTLGAARYWDGKAWTVNVSFQGRTMVSPVPLREVIQASNESDAVVIRRYLKGAVARGVVTPFEEQAIIGDLDRSIAAGKAASTPPPPTPPVPEVRKAATPTPQTPKRAVPAFPAPSPSTPTKAPVPAPVPVPVPVRVEPSVVSRWWSDAQRAMAGDVAVHGLAYLGVILLFAGVFGLIAFSSGEVQSEWRFVADVAAPTSFFLAAWFLRRRGATAVAAALTVLGGAVLPIVAVASLTDGSAVPPDLHGGALPIAQATLCMAIALGTAWLVRRNPASMLRFVVAPTFWLGAGLLLGIARDPIPSGEAIARPDALQITAILVAIALTSIATRRWREATIARATRTLTLPIAASVYVIELLVAGSESWPAAAGAIAAVAALLIIECSADRLPRAAVPVAQVVALVVGAARLFPEIEPAWVAGGAFVLLVALAEWSGRSRPTTVGTVATLGAAGLALLATLPEPWVGLPAFSVATAWLLWRRAATPPWLPVVDQYGLAPAVTLAGMGAEAWRLSNGRATVAIAAAALVAAGARRVNTAIAEDRLWRWWPPMTATVAMGLTADVPWTDPRGQVVATAALAVATLVICALGVVERTWLTAGAAIWLLANVARLLDLSADTQAVVLGSLAAAGVAWALSANGAVPLQFGYIGHLVGGVAVAVPMTEPWAMPTVLGLATAAWVATTAVHEVRGAPHVVHTRQFFESSSDREWREVDSVPLVIAGMATTATVVVALDAASAVRVSSPWAAVSVSGVALVLALLARIVHWRRAAPGTPLVLSLLLSLGAITSSGAGSVLPSPTIVTLAAGIAVVLLARPPRPLVFGFIGWAEWAGLFLLILDRVGMDRRWSDVALGGWGAATLLGACTIDRLRSGRAAAGQGVRSRALIAPATLGGLALVIGGTLGTRFESRTVIGWLLLAIAVTALAVAVLRPLGALSTVTEILLTVSLLLLVPWRPFEHPWSLVGWAALLLALAWSQRAAAGTNMLMRWDLPAFWVAHGSVAVGLVGTATYGSVPATFVSAAALSFAVAAVLRHLAWVVGGVVLALVGATAAGHGWLALALLLLGIGLTVLAVRIDDRARMPMMIAGAVSVSSGWVEFVLWQDWSPFRVLVVTAPGAAGVAWVAALAIRFRRGPVDLMATWAVTTAVGSVLTSAVLLPADDIERLTGGCTAAAATAALAMACAMAAPVAGQWSRWAATVTASGALTLLLYALDLGSTAVVLATSGLALAICAALMLLHAVRPSSPWVLPVFLLAAYSQLYAIGVLATPGPNRMALLVVVLLTLACETAAVAVFTDRHDALIASPALACAAWLVYANEALRGEPNWFTVPIGVTLLTMVGVQRWIRRTRGGSVTGLDIALLEYVGMSFVVGGALVQTATAHLWYALVAITAGFALAAWGTITRVRRRLGFGVGTVVLSAVLVVAVPLARVVPEWRGPALWLAVAAFGAAAIAVAALVEQGKRTVHRLTEALDEMTTNWERTGGPDVHNTERSDAA